MRGYLHANASVNLTWQTGLGCNQMQQRDDDLCYSYSRWGRFAQLISMYEDFEVELVSSVSYDETMLWGL